VTTVEAGLLSAVERGARFIMNRRGFESRTVQTAAGTVHAYDGAGPSTSSTIVVLHGLGSTASSFGPLLNWIRPYVRRVVALDLPGHGFSAMPRNRLTPGGLFVAVREALDTLVEEPMVLVGSSLGGALALRYALERPERLVGLALISPVVAGMSPREWDALLGSFRIESSFQARQLLSRLYHRTPWIVSLAAPALRDLMRRSAIRDVLSSATPEDLPGEEALRALTMPVLLLWGQSERLLPPSALAYLRRHLPRHAVIEEPAGFGHCPHLDDPRRLASRLLAFARLAGATRDPFDGAKSSPRASR
jgi:pimeloyl-ACP methyl ester carboxylesterase